MYHYLIHMIIVVKDTNYPWKLNTTFSVVNLPSKNSIFPAQNFPPTHYITLRDSGSRISTRYPFGTGSAAPSRRTRSRCVLNFPKRKGGSVKRGKKIVGHKCTSPGEGVNSRGGTL